MSELYWITRLCAIHNIAYVVFIICCVLLVLFGLACLINFGEDCEYDLFATGKRYIRCGIATLCISTTVCVFCPSKKDALLIYGGGAVIDYVHSSEEAKKLPDNAVKALNKWLEEDGNEDEK